MRLYLVRHAEAEDGDVDVERQLTDRGRADARRLAESLRPLEVRVREIWHSGYPRAAQTAEPIAHEIAGAALKAHDGLTPFDRTRPIAKEIKRFGGDLMIVGHEPFLGKLAARLVTGRAARAVVKLDKPSIVCLDDDDDASGEWRVRWMLSRDVTSPGQAPAMEARRGVDAATTPHGTDGPPA
jgi:phosphohistidine phosphatase